MASLMATGLTHLHGRVVLVQDGLVASKDAHAGADTGLGQIYGRDVGGLHLAQGRRHFVLEYTHKGPACCGRCPAVRGRQTRTILEASELIVDFNAADCSVRIGQVPLIPKPASITAAKKVSHPVLAAPPSPLSSDCLNA